MKTTVFLFVFGVLVGSAWAGGGFRLVCPSDTVVDCTEDLWDLSRFGNAKIYEHYRWRDAGPPDRVERDLDICGVGEIRRIWKAIDAHGQWHQCVQVIEVQQVETFTEDDIIWPESFDTMGCRISLAPKDLPDKYARPRFRRKPCSKPGYSYREFRLTFGPGCTKIVRKWKVVDWCTWDPSDPQSGGIWTKYQIIKLAQKDTPHIEGWQREWVVDAQNCDGAYIDMDTVVAVDTCGHVLEVRHTSPYADTTGPDASGFYPIGETVFYYIVEYGCGKELKLKVRVVVKNSIPPLVFCKKGIIAVLMGIDTNRDGINDVGMVDVWAKDLDKKSSPSCGNGPLRFSFSSDTTDMVRTFTCDHLGENDVEIWVTDVHGNQSFCRTKVIIQNNQARIANCRPDSLRRVGVVGRIVPYSKADLSRVRVAMVDLDSRHHLVQTSTDTVIVEHRDTFVGRSGTVYVRRWWDTTVVVRSDTAFRWDTLWLAVDQKGLFSVDSLPGGRRWNTFGIYTKPMAMRADVVDALYLRQYLWGQVTLAPEQFIAADVNNDGRVDELDYQRLVKELIIFGRSTSRSIRNVCVVPSDNLKGISPPWDNAQMGVLSLGELIDTTVGIRYHLIVKGDILPSLLPFFRESVGPKRELYVAADPNTRSDGHRYTIQLDPSRPMGMVLARVAPIELSLYAIQPGVEVQRLADGRWLVQYPKMSSTSPLVVGIEVPEVQQHELDRLLRQGKILMEGTYYDFIHGEKGSIALRGGKAQMDCAVVTTEDRGHLHIQCVDIPRATSYLVSCYDALGRRYGVWTGSCQEGTAVIDIDLRGVPLPSGWLYFTLTVGQTTKSFRVYHP